MSIYAHVIACTGWAWLEVDRLNIRRYRGLIEYWRVNPPVHQLVAAYMGFKATEKPVESEKNHINKVNSAENENSAIALMQALSGG